MPNFASMGYVGYVKFGNSLVRATSCDIKASQNIELPNLIDAKTDKTTYQLQPIEVGGSVAFPAVLEDGSATTKMLWNLAVQRGVSDGRLSKVPDEINVRYNSGSVYRYIDCYIDTYAFSVAQSGMVELTAGVKGRKRGTFTYEAPNYFYGFRNSRVVTWNDAVVTFTGGVTVNTDEIRNFSFNLNNNCQVFFTLGGGQDGLFARDVVPTKREFTGSVTIMGLNQTLADRAFSNVNRCTEDNVITWGYTVGGSMTGCSGDFRVQMTGTVFQIEEIAITNELLETTVNYKVLPGIPYETEELTTNFVISV